MKPRERWLAVAGTLSLVVGGSLLRWGHIPTREVVLPEACATPVRIVGMPDQQSDSAAVVFHGLGANAGIMDSIGQFIAVQRVRAYLVDLPGHGNSRQDFSFSRAEECAVQILSTMQKLGEIRLEKTVLVGHSLGGALVIRLADHFPAAATLAISPAPMYRIPAMPNGAVLMAPPRRMPVNLLVLLGQFDFPFSRQGAERLLAVAGGERDSPEDFRQRRAAHLEVVPLATHTTLIYSLEAQHLVKRWLLLSLPGAVDKPASDRLPNLWPGALGIAGLMMLFPLFASWISGVSPTSVLGSVPPAVSLPGTVLRWLVAGMFAVSVLGFAVPLRLLRMYSGDYLASCIMIAGVVLVTLMWGKRTKSAVTWRALAVGGVLGLATMLAFSAWMNLGLTDTWLNAPRWLRFPVLLVACLPYALAEEWALGAPPQKWPAGFSRYLRFVLLRLIIYASMVFALYAYASQQILIAVLLMYMASFSILARLGTDAVRRRTGSAVGAALFAAILMTWFVAAVFPIT